MRSFKPPEPLVLLPFASWHQKEIVAVLVAYLAVFGRTPKVPTCRTSPTSMGISVGYRPSKPTLRKGRRRRSMLTRVGLTDPRTYNRFRTLLFLLDYSNRTRGAIGNAASAAGNVDANQTFGINVTDAINNPAALAHELDSLGDNAYDPKYVGEGATGNGTLTG
jgi:hypothetical protein